MDRTDPSKYIVINKNIQQFLKNSKFKEAFTEIIFCDLLYIFDKKLAILAFCDFDNCLRPFTIWFTILT